MGTKGRSIVGMDVDELIGLLNRAYADEWLAHYQYWLGAKLVKGPMKDNAITELMEHAADELRHADMVAQRIIQLGGDPVLEPKAWYDHSNCGYDPPEDAYIRVLLEQNIKGEQCAIEVYEALMQKTKDADPITHELALQILNDEVEHEEDLQSLLEDLDLMVSRK